MTRFEIGTSGYIGSKKDWLSMPYINCLEINSTFYRLPNPKSIRTYNEMSISSEHKGLIYSVKVSKFITHMKRLRNCKAAFNKFWRAVKDLGNNLKVLLFQLPPSFKYSDINMERLKNMTYLPSTNTGGGHLNIVFEFRDSSWFRRDVTSLFKSKKWVLGGTLINKKKGTYWMGTMPAGLHLPEKTADCTYLRIHGGRGYRGGYDKKQLGQIKKAALAKKTKLNYIIFNNVFFDSRKKTCKYNKRKIRYAALCNASTFGKMTRKQRGGAPTATKFVTDWHKTGSVTTALQRHNDRVKRARATAWRPRIISTPLTTAQKEAIKKKRAYDTRERILKHYDEGEAVRRQNAKERARNKRILPHRVLARATRGAIDSVKGTLTQPQKISQITQQRQAMQKEGQFVPWIPTKFQTEQIKRKTRSTGGRRKKRRQTRKVTYLY